MSHHKCRRHSCCQHHSHGRRRSRCSKKWPHSVNQYQPFYVVDPGYQGISSKAVRLLPQPFLQNQALPVTNFQNGLVSSRSGQNQPGYGNMVPLNIVPVSGVPFQNLDLQRVNYASNETYSPITSQKTPGSVVFEHDGVGIQTTPLNVVSESNGIKALGIPVCFLGTGSKETHTDSTQRNLLKNTSGRHGGNHPRRLTEKRNSSRNRRLPELNVSNSFEVRPARIDSFLSTASENCSVSSEGDYGDLRKTVEERRHSPYERRSTEAFQMRRIVNPNAPKRYIYRRSNTDPEGEYVLVPSRGSTSGRTSETISAPVETPVRDVEPDASNSDSVKQILSEDLPKIREELLKHSVETQKRIDRLEQKIEELKACIICPGKDFGYDEKERSRIKTTQTESKSISVDHIALIPADQFKPCLCSDSRKPEDEEEMLERYSALRSSQALVRGKSKSKMSLKSRYPPKKVCCVPSDIDELDVEDCAEYVECPRNVCQCGNDASSQSIYFARTDKYVFSPFFNSNFNTLNRPTDEKTAKYLYTNNFNKKGFSNIFELFRKEIAQDNFELLTRDIQFSLDFIAKLSNKKQSIISKNNEKTSISDYKKMSNLNRWKQQVPYLNIEQNLVQLFDLNEKVRMLRKTILFADYYKLFNGLRKFKKRGGRRHLLAIASYKSVHRKPRRKKKGIFAFFKQNPLKNLVKENDGGTTENEEKKHSKKMFDGSSFLRGADLLQMYFLLEPITDEETETKFSPCYFCCPMQYKDTQTAADLMQRGAFDRKDCRVLEETHIVRCEKLVPNDNQTNTYNRTAQKNFMTDGDSSTDSKPEDFTSQARPNKIYTNVETQKAYSNVVRAPKGEVGGFQYPPSTNTFVYLAPNSQGFTQNEQMQTSRTSTASQDTASNFPYAVNNHPTVEAAHRHCNDQNDDFILHCRGNVCVKDRIPARNPPTDCRCPHIQECHCSSSVEQTCKCESRPPNGNHQKAQQAQTSDSGAIHYKAAAKTPPLPPLCSDDQKYMFIEKRECNEVSMWVCRPVGASFCNTDRDHERDIATCTEPKYVADRPIQTVDERCSEAQQTSGNLCFLRCEICENLRQLSCYDRNFQIVCKDCVHKVPCGNAVPEETHKDKDIQTRDPCDTHCWKCDDCKQGDGNDWLCRKCRTKENFRSCECNNKEAEPKATMKCYECKQCDGFWACKTCEELKEEPDSGSHSSRYSNKYMETYEEENVEPVAASTPRFTVFVKGKKQAPQEERTSNVRRTTMPKGYVEDSEYETPRSSTRRSTLNRTSDRRSYTTAKNTTGRSKGGNDYTVSLHTADVRGAFMNPSEEELRYELDEERRYHQDKNRKKKHESPNMARNLHEDIYKKVNSCNEIVIAESGQSSDNADLFREAFSTKSKSKGKVRKPEPKDTNHYKDVNIIKSCIRRRSKKKISGNTSFQPQLKNDSTPYKRTYIDGEDDSGNYSNENNVLNRIVQAAETRQRSPFRTKQLYRAEDTETGRRRPQHQNPSRTGGGKYGRDSPKDTKHLYLVKQANQSKLKHEIGCDEDSDEIVETNESSLEERGSAKVRQKRDASSISVPKLVSKLAGSKRHGQFCLKKLNLNNNKKSIYVLAKRKRT